MTSTWNYQYSVNGLSGSWCDDCGYGYTWGNQNDTDYADYYNGQFTSFAHAPVTQPDGYYQIECFASTFCAPFSTTSPISTAPKNGIR
ncbi:hypothetical protein KSC_057020 [Ktedonobacter sp. SOSP1-52]|uniref:hypothetical protein n=1 Tax=Ktedonobacter sp. SOSP1-52 TaxID=2778366 RepID=UPI0019151B9D|nr:hypothetical protein [Ktedonobacter sp. SOSP1-52]GHO66810.1 hypothetical protein KSC_057020 [Ktedonobacter sp. SOSP1-52]